MRYYTDSEGNTRVLSGGLAGVSSLGVTFFTRPHQPAAWPAPYQQPVRQPMPKGGGLWAPVFTPTLVDSMLWLVRGEGFFSQSTPYQGALSASQNAKLRQIIDTIDANVAKGQYPAVSLVDLLWITSLPPVPGSGGSPSWQQPPSGTLDSFFAGARAVLIGAPTFATNQAISGARGVGAQLVTGSVKEVIGHGVLDPVYHRIQTRITRRNPPPWLTGQDIRDIWSAYVAPAPRAPIFNWGRQGLPRTTLFSRR